MATATITHRITQSAKLRKLASIMPVFFVVLLNERMSSTDWFFPAAACFSAIKRFIATRRSRRTSTDSVEISRIENILNYYEKSLYCTNKYHHLKLTFLQHTQKMVSEWNLYIQAGADFRRKNKLFTTIWIITLTVFSIIFLTTVKYYEWITEMEIKLKRNYFTVISLMLIFELNLYFKLKAFIEIHQIESIHRNSPNSTTVFNTNAGERT